MNPESATRRLDEALAGLNEATIKVGGRPLRQLRRRELVDECRKRGLPYYTGMPATVSVRLLVADETRRAIEAALRPESEAA